VTDILGVAIEIESALSPVRTGTAGQVVFTTAQERSGRSEGLATNLTRTRSSARRVTVRTAEPDVSRTSVGLTSVVRSASPIDFHCAKRIEGRRRTQRQAERGRRGVVTQRALSVV
jgi:hypothetical protein